MLLRSAAFVRAARRLVKKHPEAGPLLQTALEALAADAFQPALKTHQLKGELAGARGCSVGYDLRIVLEFTRHEGTEAVQRNGGKIRWPNRTSS